MPLLSLTPLSKKSKQWKSKSKILASMLTSPKAPSPHIRWIALSSHAMTSLMQLQQLLLLQLQLTPTAPIALISPLA